MASQQELRTRVQSLGQQAARNEQQLKAIESKLRESSRRIQDLQARKNALDRRRLQLEASKQRVEQDLARGKVSLVEASGKLSAINQDLARSNAGLKEASDQLRDLNDNNLSLLQQNDQLLKDQKAALDERNRAEEALKIRLAEIDKQIQASRTELTEAQNAAQVYQQYSQFFLFAPVVFARGDELVRLTVPPLLSRSQAESLLNDLLVQASEVAKAKGSRAKGTNPVVSLQTRTNAQTNESGTLEDLLAELLKQLTNAKSEQVLILTSYTNAFAGQPVFGTAKVVANPVVYRAGQIVAETRINGRLSEEEVFALVGSFIKEEVNAKVRKAGMLPKTGADAGVGEVSIVSLLDLVREIRAKDQFTRVYARAAETTRASGPLNLVFQVR